MNERIRELAEQATIIKMDPFGEYVLEIDFDKEKFAELIVQECLLAISKTPELFTDEEVAVMAKCHNQVEHHFGVEE